MGGGAKYIISVFCLFSALTLVLMFFILFFLMFNQNTLRTLELRLTHIPEDESNEVEQKPCAVQDHCLKQLLHITAPI